MFTRYCNLNIVRSERKCMSTQIIDTKRVCALTYSLQLQDVHIYNYMKKQKEIHVRMRTQDMSNSKPLAILNVIEEKKEAFEQMINIFY
jgi:flavoprotein